MVRIALDERLCVSDGLGLVGRSGGRATYVEAVEQFRGFSAQMDGHSVTAVVTGEPSIHESNTMRVARTFVACVNRRGADWKVARDLSDGGAQAETGIDFEVLDRMTGEHIGCQVVRSEIDPLIWRTLSEAGRVEWRGSVAEFAARLRVAIDKKGRIPPKQRSEIILLLDATEATGAALPDVVIEFDQEWTGWVSSLGFRNVWLVGPIDEMIRRLA